MTGVARTFVSVPEILSNWCSANTMPLRDDNSGGSFNEKCGCGEEK